MKLRNSWFISSVAHLLVVLIVSWQWNLSSQEIELGKMQSHALTTYIYSKSTPTLFKVSSFKQASSLNRPTRTRSLAEQSKTQLTPSQPSTKIVQQSHNGNNKPIAALVALLHAAIQKQQRYPTSALQMERAGSTTVAFVLFPNGSIDQLKIVKPSGTEALDEAAVAAVRNALPFEGVAKYLAAPKAYQITVAFELA